MNNTEVLVSVCMITYNHEVFIREAIEGVLMQKTNFPIELIIGEDCSTDKTREICCEYQTKYPDIIKLMLPEKNLGMMHNFTETTQAAHGKYIALCEGDDYWIDPYKLQKQVDFLEANPEYGMCYTKVRRYSQKHKQYFRENYGGPCSSEILVSSYPIPTATICLRKDLLLQYKKEIKPESKKWAMGDLPTVFWFLYNSNIYFMNEITGVYRILIKSASNHTNFKDALAFTNSVCEVKQYFIDLYNISVKNGVFEDFKNKRIANLAISYKNYGLYRECVLKIHANTFKFKIKKLIGRSIILMIAYHYHMNLMGFLKSKICI